MPVEWDFVDYMLLSFSVREAVIYKIDFKKAHDYVEWDFVDYMLSTFGFGVRWRQWMVECSIMVNGFPPNPFELLGDFGKETLFPLFFSKF